MVVLGVLSLYGMATTLMALWLITANTMLLFISHAKFLESHGISLIFMDLHTMREELNFFNGWKIWILPTWYIGWLLVTLIWSEHELTEINKVEILTTLCHSIMLYNIMI
jgi:hypothetical protein